MFLGLQIALQFPYRFWDSKVQGADYFGHVPPSPEKRGMFSVFYDMRPKVRPLRHTYLSYLTQYSLMQGQHGGQIASRTSCLASERIEDIYEMFN